MIVCEGVATDAAGLRPRSLEETLFWLPTVLKRTEASDWERGFVKSMLRQAKRPKWSPSAAQRRTMNQLIERHVLTEDDPVLIDDDDRPDALRARP